MPTPSASGASRQYGAQGALESERKNARAASLEPRRDAGRVIQMQDAREANWNRETRDASSTVTRRARAWTRTWAYDEWGVYGGALVDPRWKRYVTSSDMKRRRARSMHLVQLQGGRVPMGYDAGDEGVRVRDPGCILCCISSWCVVRRRTIFGIRCIAT